MFVCLSDAKKRELKYIRVRKINSQKKQQQSRNWSVHSFYFLRKSTSNINYNIEVNRIHISDKYNNVYLQIPQHTDNQACCQ